MNNELEKLKKLGMTDDEIQNSLSAIQKILNQSSTIEKAKNIINNAESLSFKAHMPSPEEFLTEKYLGENAKGIFPYLKEAFIQLFAKDTNIKNYLILYYFIGAGKTTLVVWIKAYMGLLFNRLIDPWKYFDKQETTLFVDMSICFTKQSCEDLVIKPLKQLLLTSPAFEKIKFKDDFLQKMKSGDPEKAYWMSGGEGSEMLCIGNLHYLCASEPSQLLGLNIISASMTEFAFLSEKMGEDKCMRLWNDLDKRVWSRFNKNTYYAKIILDSSPNSLMGKADQYILKHKFDKNVVFCSGKKWEKQPWLFPIWNNDKSKTFFVFCGNSELPPKIINANERENYDSESVIECPIDIYEAMSEDISKTIRDWCGRPLCGAANALIREGKKIMNCFDNQLLNEISWIRLSSAEDSEHLIWNKIKDKYFNKNNNQYLFYRYPNAKRYVGIDLSEKSDMACLSVVHQESDIDNCIVYVVDFTICALGKVDDSINIASFKYLIKDLIELGNMNIAHVSYDNFQSAESIQFLKRLNIDCEKISVDSTIGPYLNLASYVNQNKLKIGKNIIIKNNLKSLIKGTTRNGKEIGKVTVDHLQGEWYDLDNFDFNTSMAGYYGKDATDSLCQAITLLDKYNVFTNEYKWIEQKNKDVNIKKDMIENNWIFV